MRSGAPERGASRIPGSFVGERIGPCTIVRLIGEGSMGFVCEAIDVTRGESIAVKIFHAHIAGDAIRVERFTKVVEACMPLRHPNTIQIFDVGTLPDGRPFVAMELLHGISLRQSLSNGPLALTWVVEILLQCCAALAEAHAFGIVHCDIKPENIFLLTRDRRFVVKLLDPWGAGLLARGREALTRTGVLGSEAYMSPEQARGLPPDARADLYALGIVAFEMLTGAAPFRGEGVMEVLMRHLHEPVPALPHAVPTSMQLIVERALAKDPGRRYQSAAEMLQHCQAVLADANPVSAPRRTTVVAGPPRMATPYGPRAPSWGRPTRATATPRSRRSGPPPTPARRRALISRVVDAVTAVAARAGLWSMSTVGDAVIRGVKAAVDKRTARRARADAADALPPERAPPCAAAYRPSWVAPRRQSAIHVYIVLPEAQNRVRKAAHAALDAPGNPARESHAIALWRVLEGGERVVVDVKLAGFEVGEVAPLAWRPPHVRFVVPIRAHADIALGVHRPIVTVRSAGVSREVLAVFDFDLDVRASHPSLSRWRAALIGTCAVTASAVLTATAQQAIPPAVGLPVGTACVVGGISTWAVGRAAMVPAETCDRATFVASYAAEDRDRVKRAIQLLQEQGRLPRVDVEHVLAQRPSIDAIERAQRFVVFWSSHARASRDVTVAWLTAASRRGAAGRHGSFILPVLLGDDRPEKYHPLARFESIDLSVLADALIVTAVKEEYEAVLGVDTGAVAGSAWHRRAGPTRLEVAFRDFTVDGGVLRIAVTQALGMGGVNAVDAAARLIDACAVRCLAMCGVCAGRRGEVELGDVIIADRLWQYDAGKRKVAVDVERRRTVDEQGDVDMYKIQPPAWKQAAERFGLDGSAAWLAARPRSYAEQGDWILERILRGSDPASDPDQATQGANYEKAIARLWEKGLLRDGTLALTDAGREHITRQLTLHGNRLPERKPLQVHVGPVASGNKVVEDAEVFSMVTNSVRKVLGVEMEAAAIGALASSAQLPYSVVMKAVMDHADSDKSDNFKAFAARASAECLIAFLRQNLPPRTPPLP